jgi:L-rhamnose mutarotase
MAYSATSIFLHPESRQLFAYAEIEDERLWEAIADTAVCKKWWAHMKDLMPSNSDNSPVARELKEVFHIDSSHNATRSNVSSA